MAFRTSSQSRWLEITKLLLWSTQTKYIVRHFPDHSPEPCSLTWSLIKKFYASFTRCVNANFVSDTHLVLALFAQSFLVLHGSNASQSIRDLDSSYSIENRAAQQWRLSLTEHTAQRTRALTATMIARTKTLISAMGVGERSLRPWPSMHLPPPVPSWQTWVTKGITNHDHF